MFRSLKVKIYSGLQQQRNSNAQITLYYHISVHEKAMNFTRTKIIHHEYRARIQYMRISGTHTSPFYKYPCFSAIDSCFSP